MSAGLLTEGGAVIRERARTRASREAGEAADRLKRLLAEFRLYGGFGGRDGMRLWGEVQRAVREIDQLRASAAADAGG